VVPKYVFYRLAIHLCALCIICVDHGKALPVVTLKFPVQPVHCNFKYSCQINRDHIKVPQNIFSYTAYVDNKKKFSKNNSSVLHDQTSVESLKGLKSIINMFSVCHVLNNSVHKPVLCYEGPYNEGMHASVSYISRSLLRGGGLSFHIFSACDSFII